MLPQQPLPRLFFGWAMVLGLLYCFVNPPFAVNDERAHLPRVQELAAGRLLTRHDAQGPYYVVPAGDRSRLVKYSNLRTELSGRVELGKLIKQLGHWSNRDPLVRLPASANVYSPVAYAPMLPVALIAHLLTLPALWQLYLCRMASLLCFAWLGAWSVACSGRLAWLFFALGLMPMALTQAAGVSGDSLTSGLSFVFWAVLIRNTLQAGGQLSRTQERLLVVLSAAIVLCKSVYLLFLPSLLALQRRTASESGWRSRVPLPLIAISTALLALSLWARVNSVAARQLGGGGMRDQLMWVLEHPAGALAVAGTTLATRGGDYLIQLVALRDTLARQAPVAGAVITIPYLLLLIALSWGASRASEPAPLHPRRSAAVLLAAATTCSLAIFVAMYAFDTPVGASTVNGVQGRYFLPLAPAFFAALSVVGRPAVGDWLSARPCRRILPVVAAVNATTLLTIVSRYYLPVDW